MTSANLKGVRVLVAEDEYLLADDVREMLADAGAEVLGPVPSVEDAAALIDREQAIDVALLDINLRGQMVFAIADRLRERDIAFAFVTGYDTHTLPARFAGVSTIQKPVRTEDVVRLVAPALQPGAG